MFGDSKAFSGFAVKDLDAAEEFYSKKLGLEVTRGEMGLRLHFGANTVFVYGKPNHEPAVFTVLNFPVDDVEAAVDKLVAAGIKMEKYDGMGQDEKGISHSFGTDHGPDIAWFQDPSGNILAVLHGDFE